MTVEPTRLIDDAVTAGTLKGDLEVAAAARVEGLDFSAGLASLQSAIGAETGAIPVVGPSAGGSLGPKIAVAAVAVGIAAWFGLRQPTPPPTPHVPVAVATPQPEPSSSFGAGRSSPQPTAPALEPVIDDVPTVAAVPDEEQDEATAVTPEPAAEPESTDKSKPRRTRVVGEDQDEDPHASVLEEAKAVQAARRALASAPSDALRHARQIAKDFPKGQLVEERRAIEIQALAKLGRDDEAREKAETFLAKYGRGPHAAAVRRATGL